MMKLYDHGESELASFKELEGYLDRFIVLYTPETETTFFARLSEVTVKPPEFLNKEVKSIVLSKGVSAEGNLVQKIIDNVKKGKKTMQEIIEVMKKEDKRLRTIDNHTFMEVDPKTEYEIFPIFQYLNK